MLPRSVATVAVKAKATPSIRSEQCYDAPHELPTYRFSTLGNE